MDSILQQGRGGRGNTGATGASTDAIQTLARMAMRTHQSVGYLEQSMQLELQLHDGALQDQVFTC
eukprot:2013318-Amphidinium_carterae.1